MKILAHRGQWLTPGERNTATALQRAYANGFGIETDVRDRSGELVISHDPPSSAVTLTLDDVFALFRTGTRDQLIALNVKADGLRDAIAESLERTGFPQERLFVFDMSVPDTRAYLHGSFPVYTRSSDVEPVPPYLTECEGVWVDAFSAEHDHVTAAQEFLRQRRAVAFVSPELHGRDSAEVWHRLRESGAPDSSDFLLCTDAPDAARDYFGAAS